MLTELVDEPENKNIYYLKSHMPSHLPMKVFIKEYAQIDIWGKLEPAIIKLSGWRDDLNVYISTSERYPDAKNCQAFATNQNKIEFYVRGGAHSRESFKFQKTHLFICFESSLEVSLKVLVSFGGEEKGKTGA